MVESSRSPTIFSYQIRGLVNLLTAHMKAFVCPQIPDLGWLKQPDCNHQKQKIPWFDHL